MSKEVTLYLDVNRVNRPFVQQLDEEELFGGQLARVKEIFELLEADQSDALKVARGESQGCLNGETTRVKAIEGWSSGSNIIGIFGKRGSGKSSVMLSVKEKLESDPMRDEKYRFIKEKSLSIWLDPALFMDNRLARVFLAKLYGMFKVWSEEQARCNTKRNESLQKRLHEAFQRVQQALGGIGNGEGMESSLRNLLLTAETGTIQHNVFELVELMLEAKGCAGGKMVLFLDDFDVQVRDVIGYLEDWKHFLNLPNVVVVLSAAQVELEELVVVGLMRNRRELFCAVDCTDTKSMFPSRPWLEKGELYERSHAYLLKVVGSNRRVYLSPNTAVRATKLKIRENESKWGEEKRIEHYLSQSTALALNIHFYQVSKDQEKEGKFDFILNAWRDSSLREQVIALTQLRGTTKLAVESIIDANFSQSEIRQLETALPNTANRLKFSSDVVRWITSDRNAKSGKSLRDFCESTLRTEFRSSWQAYLFVNYMWRILGEDESEPNPVVNFLNIDRESDALFWGGGALSKLSKLRGDALSNKNTPKAAKVSSFTADLIASDYWRTDEKANWKPQLLRPKLEVNPLNAIPRLLLGIDFNSWFASEYRDDEIMNIQQRFIDWSLYLRFENSHLCDYLKNSLANPIFFSSLLAQFSKGSNRRADGIPGFFEQLEKNLVANTLKVIELRWGEESGLYQEMKELFKFHPLNPGAPECRLDLMFKVALDFNDEEKKIVLELREELSNWKRFVRYFYTRRDEFLPDAWRDNQDPLGSGADLKKKARSLQVYLSRDVHKQKEGKPLPIYSELNRAMRKAEEGELAEGAQRVYAVIQEYIKYSEKMVRELELQIQDAESK